MTGLKLTKEEKLIVKVLDELDAIRHRAREIDDAATRAILRLQNYKGEEKK